MSTKMKVGVGLLLVAVTALILAPPPRHHSRYGNAFGASDAEAKYVVPPTCQDLKCVNTGTGPQCSLAVGSGCKLTRVGLSLRCSSFLCNTVPVE